VRRPLIVAALAVAPVLLARAQDPKRLANGYRVAEAVFSSTLRTTTTPRDPQKKVVTGTARENDVEITWTNKPAASGKVLVELHQKGTLGLSNGPDSWRYELGQPPCEALTKLEQSGAVRTGWLYEIDKGTAAVRLLKVWDAFKKEAEPNDGRDERGRKGFEEQQRLYQDRPAEDGATWTTEEEIPLDKGVKAKRKFTFKVGGTRRYKGFNCAVVQVTAEMQSGATKILEQSYDREDLFDLDHGLLARVVLDAKLVVDKEGVPEERRTEWRWTLESVREK
jgi:hypothetical protein